MQPGRCPLRYALALVAAGAQLAAGAAHGQPSGRYQARPGGVLACGGIAGFCDVLQLEGSLDLEILALPFPDAVPVARIAGSDLRLQPVGGRVFLATQPFPASDGLPLVGLEGERVGERWRFSAPPGSAEEVALELVPAGDTASFLLRGSYTEGCCDRFAYELGGVVFDWTGPGGAPVLRLLDGRFEVEVAWADFASRDGHGVPVRSDDRSGSFWFFEPDNPELLVKMIPACEPPFDSVWFFTAGLTNVGVTIVVRDLGGLGGPIEKQYTSPAGVDFQPVLDTAGFPCPAAG